MFLLYFKVSWGLKCNVILHSNSSCALENIIIHMFLVIVFFLSFSPGSTSFSWHSVDIRTLAKVLIMAAEIFPGASKKNLIFLNRNILFPKFSEKIRPIFQIFWRYLNVYEESKLKTNVKMRTISIFSWTSLIFYGMEWLFLCCSSGDFLCKLLTRRYISQFTRDNGHGLAE